MQPPLQIQQPLLSNLYYIIPPKQFQKILHQNRSIIGLNYLARSQTLETQATLRSLKYGRPSVSSILSQWMNAIIQGPLT